MIAAVVVLLAAAQVPDGFQGAKWGDSRKAVIVRFEAAPVTDYGLLVAKVSYGEDEEVLATFYFLGGELGAVEILVNGGAGSAFRLLQDKYGKPISEEKDGQSAIYVWESRSSGIELSKYGESARVLYYDKARWPKIRQANLEAAEKHQREKRKQALDSL